LSADGEAVDAVGGAGDSGAGASLRRGAHQLGKRCVPDQLVVGLIAAERSGYSVELMAPAKRLRPNWSSSSAPRAWIPSLMGMLMASAMRVMRWKLEAVEV